MVGSRDEADGHIETDGGHGTSILNSTGRNQDMGKVDVQFRIIGTEIPADHGYHLFSTISRVVPELHGDDEVGVHPIPGRLVGNRRLALTERSRLTIRLASERIREILSLAGKSLEINFDLQTRSALAFRRYCVAGQVAATPEAGRSARDRTSRQAARTPRWNGYLSPSKVLCLAGSGTCASGSLMIQ